MKKLCIRCKKEKDRRQFPKRKSGALYSYCKICNKELHSLWVKRNKSSFAAINRKSNLKRRYGITPEEFDRMLARQKGLCAICGTDKPKGERNTYGAGPGTGWRIDHDHDSGKLRGILCHRCNAGLGLFEDKTTVLQKAIIYLGGI